MKLISASICLCMVIILSAMNVYALGFAWNDIFNQNGTTKFDWVMSGEIKKAAYLELYRQSINYCLENIGKAPKELDQNIIGPRVEIFYKVTPETVAMLYREYGDRRRASSVKYNYWVSSQGSPELMNADENPLYFVIAGFEEAEMYADLVRFYPVAYQELMNRFSQFTTTNTLDANFEEFKTNWPKQADEYQELMRNWRKAKKLAKTTKPKPLDPAVQHHEWFYSDKQEEVLKALEYYHKFNVRFMLEKALKHKDPIIAAKAKEYLDTPVKEGAGNDKKK